MSEQIYYESKGINPSNTAGKGIVIRLETMQHENKVLRGVTVMTVDIEEVSTEETIYHEDKVLPYGMTRSAVIRESIKRYDALVEKWIEILFRGE